MIIPIGNKKAQKYTTFQNQISNDWLDKIALTDVSKMPPAENIADMKEQYPDQQNLNDAVGDSNSPQLNGQNKPAETTGTTNQNQQPRFDPMTGEPVNMVGSAELFQTVQKMLKSNEATADLDIVGFNAKGDQYTFTVARKGTSKIMKPS